MKYFLWQMSDLDLNKPSNSLCLDSTLLKAKCVIVTVNIIRILKISNTIFLVLSDINESDFQLENNNSCLYHTEGRTVSL